MESRTASTAKNVLGVSCTTLTNNSKARFSGLVLRFLLDSLWLLRGALLAQMWRCNLNCICMRSLYVLYIILDSDMILYNSLRYPYCYIIHFHPFFFLILSSSLSLIKDPLCFSAFHLQFSCSNLWSPFTFLISVITPGYILISDDLGMTDERKHAKFVFWGLAYLTQYHHF